MPEDIAFACLPQLARTMIARAIAAGVPFAWVAADSIYGVGEIEMTLRQAGKGYVLGVKGSSQSHSWAGKPEVAGTAEEIASNLEERLVAFVQDSLSVATRTGAAKPADFR